MSGDNVKRLHELVGNMPSNEATHRLVDWYYGTAHTFQKKEKPSAVTVGTNDRHQRAGSESPRRRAV